MRLECLEPYESESQLCTETLSGSCCVLVDFDTTSRSFEVLARGLQTLVTIGVDRIGWVFLGIMGLGLVIGAARV